MMFGGDLRTFHKKKGVYLLLNGLERDGLTGLVPGKHMDRIMVLYEEVLTQFCDHPQPRGDADRIAAAETQVQSLWDLIVAREDLIQAGEASRVAAARRQELARSEAERQLKDLEEELQRVKEELQEAKKKGRRTQKELQVVKEELLEVNEEFREVKKRKRGTEKELEGVKNELEKAMEKVREELDGTKTEGSKSKKESEGPNYELNEARKEVEGIRKELHKARETATKESQETIESLDAKACLAGFWILCSLGLVVVLACMVCS